MCNTFKTLSVLNQIITEIDHKYKLVHILVLLSLFKFQYDVQKSKLCYLHYASLKNLRQLLSITYMRYPQSALWSFFHKIAPPIVLKTIRFICKFCGSTVSATSHNMDTHYRNFKQVNRKAEDLTWDDSLPSASMSYDGKHVCNSTVDRSKVN